MPKTKSKKKAPAHLASQKTRRVRGIRSDIDNLKLQGAQWSTKLREPMDARLTRTIEGASTVAITVHDKDMALLRSKLMETRLDIELDGLWFRSVRLEKSGHQYTATFEDREVALMRRVEEPRKGFRNQVTRAEFVFSQVREAWRLRGGYRFPVHIPKLHKVRPIKSAQDASEFQIQMDSGDLKGEKGIDRSENLTVKGAPASESQIQQAEIILSVGVRLDAPEQALVASIAGAIGESGLDPSAVNPTSRAAGVFQLLPSTAASTGLSPQDTAATAHYWFVHGYYGRGGGIELANEGTPPGQIAELVEGSGVDAYTQWVPEAERWVAAFSGGSGIHGISGSATFDVAARYAFERKPGEDAWDSTGRLAEEVKFRRFVSAGVFYYLAEDELLTQKPTMYIDGDTKGIDDIDFAHDHGQRTQTINITARARAWAAGPATLIKLNEDWGPAQGRYIVNSIEANLFNDQVSITAEAPLRSLPEPAPETSSKTVDFGESGTMTAGGGGGDPSGVQIESTAPGPPSWGGAAYVFRQFIHPFMEERGLQPGAQKEDGHSEDGDHELDGTGTISYATDYGCADVASSTETAKAICRALGSDGSTIGTFGTFNVNIDGHVFRVQVLWHVEDHYDHIHVGLRLVN